MTLKEVLIMAGIAGACGWFLVAVFRNAMRHSALPAGRKAALFAGGLVAVALVVWLAVALGANPRAVLPR